MPRPPSKDPSEKATITLPRSVKEMAGQAAEEAHLSFSAWVAVRIRTYFALCRNEPEKRD
jgi:predicted HicB family RNase H-like nuclease